jgi:hypothetical protein
VIEGAAYDVRIYKISTYRGKRGTSYTVRWRIGASWHRKTFRLAAQADAYRSELRTAARRGEEFDAATGEPTSWHRAALQAISWFDLACQFVDTKWPDVSPRYRVDIARALTAATPAMYAESVGSRPADRLLRHAMHHYAFNTRRRGQATAEIANAQLAPSSPWRRTPDWHDKSSTPRRRYWTGDGRRRTRCVSTRCSSTRFSTTRSS